MNPGHIGSLLQGQGGAAVILHQIGTGIKPHRILFHRPGHRQQIAAFRLPGQGGGGEVQSGVCVDCSIVVGCHFPQVGIQHPIAGVELGHLSFRIYLSQMKAAVQVGGSGHVAEHSIGITAGDGEREFLLGAARSIGEGGGQGDGLGLGGIGVQAAVAAQHTFLTAGPGDGILVAGGGRQGQVGVQVFRQVNQRKIVLCIHIDVLLLGKYGEGKVLGQDLVPGGCRSGKGHGGRLAPGRRAEHFPALGNGLGIAGGPGDFITQALGGQGQAVAQCIAFLQINGIQRPLSQNGFFLTINLLNLDTVQSGVVNLQIPEGTGHQIIPIGGSGQIHRQVFSQIGNGATQGDGIAGRLAVDVKHQGIALHHNGVQSQPIHFFHTVAGGIIAGGKTHFCFPRSVVGGNGIGKGQLYIAAGIGGVEQQIVERIGLGAAHKEGGVIAGIVFIFRPEGNGHGVLSVQHSGGKLEVVAGGFCPALQVEHAGIQGVTGTGNHTVGMAAGGVGQVVLQGVMGQKVILGRLNQPAGSEGNFFRHIIVVTDLFAPDLKVGILVITSNHIAAPAVFLVPAGKHLQLVDAARIVEAVNGIFPGEVPSAVAVCFGGEGAVGGKGHFGRGAGQVTVVFAQINPQKGAHHGPGGNLLFLFPIVEGGNHQRPAFLAPNQLVALHPKAAVFSAPGIHPGMAVQNPGAVLFQYGAMAQTHPGGAKIVVSAGILKAGGEFIADVAVQGAVAVGSHVVAHIVQVGAGDGPAPGHPDVVVVVQISVGDKQIVIAGVGIIADVGAFHSILRLGTVSNVHRRAALVQKAIFGHLLDKDARPEAAPGHVPIPGGFLGDDAGVDGVAGSPPAGLAGLHHNALEHKAAVGAVGSGHGDAGVSAAASGTGVVQTVLLPHLHHIRRPDVVHRGDSENLIGNQAGDVELQPFPAAHIGVLGADHREHVAAHTGAVDVIIAAGLVVEDAGIVDIGVVAGSQGLRKLHAVHLLGRSRQHPCAEAGTEHGKT